MTDDAELAGLDPFDLLDREAARIEDHLAVLPEAEWSRQSRCALWSVRDVLAHLADAENYHRACLDGRVSEFIAEMEAQGGHDIASANALAIAALAGRTPQDLLSEWSDSNAETRRRFRERGDGRIDTSVGDYGERSIAAVIAAAIVPSSRNQVPVKLGGRFWRNAVIASTRSLEPRKAEFQTAT